MKKEEFLGELEALLADLPPEERRAALDYYAEYLDEAGTENEEIAVASLGGPEKAAQDIRSGGVPEAPASAEGAPELPVLVWKQEEKTEDTAKKPAFGAASAQSCGPAYSEDEDDSEQETASGFRENRTLWIVLLVLLCPVLIGAAGTVFGLLAGVVGTAVGILGAGVGLLFGGLGIAVRSFFLLRLSTADCMVTMGLALLCAAAGGGVLAGGLWLFARGIPALWRWVVRGFRFVKGKVWG